MKVSFKFKADVADLCKKIMGGLLLGRDGPFDYRTRYDEEEYVHAAMVFVGAYPRYPAANGRTAAEENSDTFDRYLHPQMRDNLTQIWATLTDWVNGRDHAPYRWEQYDHSFPVDNALIVEAGKVSIWVNNSSISIERVAEGEFAFAASGTRHSFGANHTGKIAEAIVQGSQRRGDISDIEIESQATQPWDNTLDNLFRETRSARARRELKALLSDIHSERVRSAAKELLTALNDPVSGQGHNEEELRLEGLVQN